MIKCLEKDQESDVVHFDSLNLKLDLSSQICFYAKLRGDKTQYLTLYFLATLAPVDKTMQVFLSKSAMCVLASVQCKKGD